MKKYTSPLILLLASVLWGFAFVAQKAATTLPTFTLLFSRSTVATLILIPIVVLFDKLSKNGRKLISFKERKIGITRREFLGGAVCGVFLFIASALQQAGIAETDAGKASFITALYVVIVPIYALILGKRSPVNAWIGVALAIVGFYLLCIKEGLAIAPSDVLIFLCALMFAMQIVAIDLLLTTCDGVRLSLIQFAAMSVFSLITALIFELPFSLTDIAAVLPEILFLGIGSSGIAYTLQIIGQKNTEPAVASIILSLESVFGALFSALLLGERMTAIEYAGCAIVLSAVIISQLNFVPPSRKDKQKSGARKN